MRIRLGAIPILVAFTTIWAGTTVAAPTRTSVVLTGQSLYLQACAYCHGNQGQGGARLGAPQLWGSGNPISGGAYDTPQALSQFIQKFMPLQPVNGINPGSLTHDQARSLAQYILSQT